MADKEPLVGIIMGSQSDWPTMKNAAGPLLSMKFLLAALNLAEAHRTTVPLLVEEPGPSSS